MVEYIIEIDSRERALFEHIENYGQYYKINFKTGILQVGDYAIVRNGVILAIFERKSLKDLSASIKDGRIANVQKLLKVRELTKCKLFYIIEGRMIQDSVDRIPMKALKSHLFHLQYRDSIGMIHTETPEQTAKELFLIAESIIQIDKSDEKIGSEEKTEHLLREKQESNVHYTQQILSSLPGISIPTSIALLKQDITFKKLFDAQITQETIANIKYDSGKCFGNTKAHKMILMFKNIDNDQDLQLQILSAVDGLSRNSALTILQQKNLREILAMDVEDVALILKTKKAKIGPSCAGKILKYLGT